MYYIEWRIDVPATSPEEAAIKAREIQRDPESTATVFHVAREGKDPRRFDFGNKFKAVDVENLPTVEALPERRTFELDVTYSIRENVIVTARTSEEAKALAGSKDVATTVRRRFEKGYLDLVECQVSEYENYGFHVYASDDDAEYTVVPLLSSGNENWDQSYIVTHPAHFPPNAHLCFEP
jgi:hypothetical protein